MCLKQVFLALFGMVLSKHGFHKSEQHGLLTFTGEDRDSSYGPQILNSCLVPVCKRLFETKMIVNLTYICNAEVVKSKDSVYRLSCTT